MNKLHALHPQNQNHQHHNLPGAGSTANCLPHTRRPDVVFSRRSSCSENASPFEDANQRRGISHSKAQKCWPDQNNGQLLRMSSSFRNEFGHAAAETYLITQLAFKLLKYLGIGYRWLTKLLALAMYAMFLLPGFIQVGYYYFFDKRIHRSIVYGPKPRNRLDLYMPENITSPKPIVVFITGGAWIIGYKAWGSLLGIQLLEQDVIVACIDYRNFPQGSISDMIEDITQGISFICENATKYGGDPNRLYLAGQSAGAHLAACAIVEQAIKENSLEQGLQPSLAETKLKWKPSVFKAYFGISGGYNLKELVEHFHNRGLYRRLFLSIMEGEESLLRYSPEIRVQTLSTIAKSLLPPIHLFHGTADLSIPSDASSTFADVLASLGVDVTLRLYKDKTHTDVFLQDPMRGGQDELLLNILSVIRKGDVKSGENIIISRPRLVPEVLLQLARRVSPF